jgi:hypothetical protein
MDQQEAARFFQQVYGGSWITQGLGVAAELGIPDILASGPRTCDELAKQTKANGDALYRLLRALASVGVFAMDEQGRFTLTPLAEMLRRDVPGSQRAFAIMMGEEFCQAWGKLLHSVRTGEPGFNHRYGMPFFEYMTRYPDRHGLYDSAMNTIHGPETEPMLAAYDFSTLRTVVDVGGGNGQNLTAILKRHPSLHGILFDLPAVVERARARIEALGLSDRCRIQGGDFFSAVPPGADAYVLRHIIHDWQDKEAIAILRNCRLAANPGGKVLVVETVIPPGNEPSFGKWLDLMMLLVDGRQRTEADYNRLFSGAGLKLNRIVPTAAGVSIIEGVNPKD